ncbi:MAG: hypothetical protein K2H21_00105, partial [Muribaculaceae bacterium]|nr:hypothetical protein [Muribaculaceae bacterium]
LLLNPGAHARLVAEATVTADVAPDGTLTLLPEAPGGTGEMPARSYLFKEVSHILPDNCKKG